MTAKRRKKTTPSVTLTAKASSKHPKPSVSTTTTTTTTATTTTRGNRRHRGRCGDCPPCQRPDCGECHQCLRKRKFGGDGKSHKSCMQRYCWTVYGPKASQLAASGIVTVTKYQKQYQQQIKQQTNDREEEEEEEQDMSQNDKDDKQEGRSRRKRRPSHKAESEEDSESDTHHASNVNTNTTHKTKDDLLVKIYTPRWKQEQKVSKSSKSLSSAATTTTVATESNDARGLSLLLPKETLERLQALPMSARQAVTDLIHTVTPNDETGGGGGGTAFSSYLRRHGTNHNGTSTTRTSSTALMEPQPVQEHCNEGWYSYSYADDTSPLNVTVVSLEETLVSSSTTITTSSRKTMATHNKSKKSTHTPPPKRLRRWLYGQDIPLQNAECTMDRCFACQQSTVEEEEEPGTVDNLSVPYSDVLLCDGVNCGREYHMKCCQPPLVRIPKGNWYCFDCTSTGTTKNHDDDDDDNNGGSAVQLLQEYCQTHQEWKGKHRELGFGGAGGGETKPRGRGRPPGRALTSRQWIHDLATVDGLLVQEIQKQLDSDKQSLLIRPLFGKPSTDGLPESELASLLTVFDLLTEKSYAEKEQSRPPTKPDTVAKEKNTNKGYSTTIPIPPVMHPPTRQVLTSSGHPHPLPPPHPPRGDLFAYPRPFHGYTWGGVPYPFPPHVPYGPPPLAPRQHAPLATAPSQQPRTSGTVQTASTRARMSELPAPAQQHPTMPPPRNAGRLHGQGDHRSSSNNARVPPLAASPKYQPSPRLLLGKPIRLFIDELNVHRGRIVNFRLTKDAVKRKFKDENAKTIECLLEHYEFLVRFPAGCDYRKSPTEAWLLLEEHNLMVGTNLVYVRCPNNSSSSDRSKIKDRQEEGRHSAWRPAMIWRRSRRAMILPHPSLVLAGDDVEQETRARDELCQLWRLCRRAYPLAIEDFRDYVQAKRQDRQGAITKNVLEKISSAIILESPQRKRPKPLPKTRTKSKLSTPTKSSNPQSERTGRTHPLCVEQVDLETGKVVQQFPSISQAHRATGCSWFAIKKALDDDEPEGGFKWRYGGDNESDRESGNVHDAATRKSQRQHRSPSSVSPRHKKSGRTIPRAVEQRHSPNGRAIRRYPSISRAHTTTGISWHDIKVAIECGNPDADKGYYWVEVEDESPEWNGATSRDASAEDKVEEKAQGVSGLRDESDDHAVERHVDSMDDDQHENVDEGSGGVHEDTKRQTRTNRPKSPEVPSPLSSPNDDATSANIPASGESSHESKDAVQTREKKDSADDDIEETKFFALVKVYDADSRFQFCNLLMDATSFLSHSAYAEYGKGRSRLLGWMALAEWQEQVNVRRWHAYRVNNPMLLPKALSLQDEYTVGPLRLEHDHQKRAKVDNITTNFKKNRSKNEKMVQLCPLLTDGLDRQRMTDLLHRQGVDDSKDVATTLSCRIVSLSNTSTIDGL